MEDKNFHLGLCLAGAVTAGAYTAGVIDYLFEALDKWDKRKKENVPGTPSHNVVIDVIGGASAGGMTGIITAAALNNEIKPVKFPTSAQEIFAEQPQNKFYHSWVDLISKDMFSMMLNTSDITKDSAVYSLANAGFIDKIADKVVTIDTNNIKPLPPYINNQLKIFTTLTNLEGFPYEISCQGNTTLNTYYMAIHNDYACFQLNKAETEKDGWMLLDFKTGKNVDIAKSAAMATGAFPVGLKSRKLSRKADDVNTIKWLADVDPVDGPEYITQNIDGGTINNEPFEKVRDVLKEITKQEDPKDYNNPGKFNSSILFVDPFPSEKPGKFKIDTGLFKTIGYTLSALIGQGRTKPGIVSKAMNTNLAGQFLIAPSRRRPTLHGEDESVQGEKAIACGAFDGFSGFINKEFRVHDYFLGRFNCEIMLRDYFIISESALNDNEIFRDGYAGVDRSTFCIIKEGKENITVIEKMIVDGVEQEKEVRKEQSVKKKYYPIIPVFEPRGDKFPIPVFSSGSNWPVIKDKEVERFRPLVKKRAHAILLNIVKLRGFTRILLWIGARLILNKMLSNAAMVTIKKALKDHQLLKPEPGNAIDDSYNN
jgi:hypothetical protein